MKRAMRNSRPITTDLATLVGIMQEICLDAAAIVTCLRHMLGKGMLRRPSAGSGLNAAA